MWRRFHTVLVAVVIGVVAIIAFQKALEDASRRAAEKTSIDLGHIGAQTTVGEYSGSFMLNEYERISQLWQDENRQAELRVGFFLTVVSAAAAAIGLASQRNEKWGFFGKCLVVSVLIALFLFGFAVLSRLNSRDATQRAIRQSFTEVQLYFARADPGIAKYLAASSKAFEPSGWSSRHQRLGYVLSGYLSYMTIFGEAIVIAGIVFAIRGTRQKSLWRTILPPAYALVVACLLLYSYVLVMPSRLAPSAYSGDFITQTE